jgi:hypothetical protein
MSVPGDVMKGGGFKYAGDDPLSQFNDGQGILGQTNSTAADAGARIPQLQAQQQGFEDKQAGVGMAMADDNLQAYNQVAAQGDAPTRNTKIMDLAPLMIGLTAIGGRATGLHAKTMLAATNGMVQGLLQGSEQQFNDAQAKYEQARKKILDLHTLRQQYYQTLYQAYGDQANAKERAIKASRDLVNDGFKHDIDVVKANAQADKIMNDLQTKSQGLDLKALQIQVSQMKEKAQEAHWDKQDKVAEEKVTEKSKAGKEAQSDILNDISALEKEMEANSGMTGAAGWVNRKLEVGKTMTGMGDQTAPANRFQARVNALLLKVPKALTGSSKSAKDERERVNDIANVLNMGTTGPIAKQKLEELKDIVKRQHYDDAAQVTGSLDPQVLGQANGIKQQFKAGKITQEQAIAELQKLGLQ